jgi:DNA-binding transcriptional regulator YhcF (GntR family)
MSLKQISRQTCLIYRTLRNAKDWITVREIVADIDANPRTVRNVLREMTEAGLLSAQTTFAGFRYRTVDRPDADAKEIINRIVSAEKTLGLMEKPA